MSNTGPHLNNSFTLVGIGEILWDLLPEGKQLGGAPANFAYHAHELGANGIVLSCVGRDEFGGEVLEQLRRVGLDASYIAVDAKRPTGTVSVTLDTGGKPRYVVHENVAWDFIPQSQAFLELAGRADTVCFGSLCQRSPVSRATIRSVLAGCRTDCLRVFDINLRQSYFDRALIQESLELTDILKLNEEELQVIVEMFAIEGPEETVISLLAQQYLLRLVAVTKGENGSALYMDGKVSHHPGYKERVIDTVGAGDAFTAALTLGLIRGDTLDEINEGANRIAGYVCTQTGAMPQLPSSLVVPAERPSQGNG